MFKQTLTGLGLGFGAYAIWRYFNPDFVTTGDGEGQGLLSGVAGDFLNVGYQMAGKQGGGMSISLAGLAHIKKWEGYRARRYLDAAGKPTIGYGHLLKVYETFDTVTEAQANKLLVQDVTEAENAVNRLVKVRISQTQFDGLVSFVFNVGVGNFSASSLRKYLNAGNYQLAQQEFVKWIYITQGGQKVVSNGLVNRRLADARLFAGIAA